MPSYPLPLAIVLTVVFALTTVGFAALVFARGESWLGRTIAGVHLLMSLAMLAMPWSWGMRVAPPLGQVVVFGAATAFFLALLVAPELRSAATKAGGGAHSGHFGPLLIGYHAVMGAGMVVMGAVMLQPSAPAGRSSSAMDSMPGMQMSGSGGMPSRSDASAGIPPGGEHLVYWIFVALFAVGAVWALTRAVAARRSGLGPASDLLLSAMSAGMALAFIPF